MLTSIRRIVALLAGAAILLLATAPQASAHPLSTTAVLLNVDAGRVTATVDLPLDELSIAVDQELTATTVLHPTTVRDLRSYVRAHLSATDAAKRAWTAEVSGGHVKKVDGVDNLVLDATLTPSGGSVGDFVLHYDAVIDKLVSHRVFVSARYGHTGAYTTLAMLSWQRTSVPVASTHVASQTGGFLPAISLGIHHIGSGSDHLLFLLMLLLAAPLVARAPRWVRGDDLGRAGLRVVHVVSAFAVGHSVTLAFGALGWVHLSTRLVESGIALSVLVSAIHAIRPLVRRGEFLIAGSFGLLHGLSFAAVLDALNLTRGGLVTTMLGFNFGIEAAQLLVVALVMPSLIILSSTTAYPALRTTTAVVGATLATGWLAQRTGVLTTNSLEPAADVLVDHPFVVAAGLAALALVAAAAAQRAGHLPATVADEALTDEPALYHLPGRKRPQALHSGFSRLRPSAPTSSSPCRFHSSAARQRTVQPRPAACGRRPRVEPGR